MIAKITATAISLLLAAGAFWGDALGAGHVFNPFGILFLLLTAIIWFGWGPIHDGYNSMKNESGLPIIRLGSTIIRGMRRAPQPRRSSS